MNEIEYSNLPLVILQTKKFLDGTAGKVFMLDEYGMPKLFCSSLELPWIDNKNLESCVPLGDYLCRWTYSNSFKRFMYILEKTSPREGVRIHAANRLRDLRGCIAMGEEITEVNDSIFLTNSKHWIKRFEDKMGFGNFILKITSEDEDERFRIYLPEVVS